MPKKTGPPVPHFEQTMMANIAAALKNRTPANLEQLQAWWANEKSLSLRSSVNHKMISSVALYVKGDSRGRTLVLQQLKKQEKEGHMLGEFNSPTHSQQNEGPCLAGLIRAIEIKDREVIEAFTRWWLVHSWLAGKFWYAETHQRVSPGGRPWKDGDDEDDQPDSTTSHYSDRLYRFIGERNVRALKTKGKGFPGEYALDHIRDLPSDLSHRLRIAFVDGLNGRPCSVPVKIIHPVHRAPFRDGFRAWWPGMAGGEGGSGGKGAQVAVEAAGGHVHGYFQIPSEWWDLDMPGTEVIGA